MSREPSAFLKSLQEETLSGGERAIALLWLHSIEDHAAGRTPTQLAREIEAAGYPTQNATRLREYLARDRRTAKAGKDAFRVRITARPELDRKYGRFARSRPVPLSDSVLPTDLFAETRGYVERVVGQVNASFDFSLYDCCAVMCRRLLETLIIEVFEAKGKSAEIKSADGNFLMFSGLLTAVEGSDWMTLSRNGLQGLRDFKRLGDLSAHNRRFNARHDDISRVRDGIRVASEELLHLADLV